MKSWTAAWLERIKDLYAVHAQLMATWEDAAAPAPREAPTAAARLEEAGAAWDQALAVIDEAREKQMAAPGLQEPAKKALATLDREWDGLAAHRGYPMIGLDNNPAERAIRRPVVTRKNAYGSRNDDAARLAARVWTVTATAEMAGLNVLTYLSAFLDACGQNGGRPPSGPDLERFLAGSSRRPPHLGTAAGPRITAPKQPQKRRTPEYGHAAPWHARSRDFRILTVTPRQIAVPSATLSVGLMSWGWYMRRKVTCPCGHTMFAKNDDELFDIVRRHVDDNHPDLGLSDQAIREMIAAEGEDA